MKNRIPLFTSLLLYGLYRVMLFYTEDPWLSITVFVVPLGLLLLNFQLRKKLKHKNWFIKGNPFFAKETTQFESDIHPDLLYNKLLEVVNDSSFKLRDQNLDQHQLLISTPPNFFTWGENIYIQIGSNGEGSSIQFTSVTIFGNSSWSRNRNNFDQFYNNFQESLII